MLNLTDDQWKALKKEVISGISRAARHETVEKLRQKIKEANKRADSLWHCLNECEEKNKQGQESKDKQALEKQIQALQTRIDNAIFMIEDNALELALETLRGNDPLRGGKST